MNKGMRFIVEMLLFISLFCIVSATIYAFTSSDCTISSNRALIAIACAIVGILADKIK